MAESWLFAKNPTSRVVKVVIGSMSVIAILRQLRSVLPSEHPESAIGKGREHEENAQQPHWPHQNWREHVREDKDQQCSQKEQNPSGN